jgi:phosphate transport system substrate-binding protein
MRIARQWPRPRLQGLALVFLSLLQAPQALGQTSPGPGTVSSKLRISGSLILFPLVTDIAHRFEAQHPGISVDVQPGGASKGEADVRSGASEIGMLPRGLTDTDRDLFAFPIARGGVAVIVNAKNPVNAINTGQLIGIVTGRISNWSALGGRDAPVNLALRREGEGTTEFILGQLKLRRAQVTQHTPITSGAAAINFAATTEHGVALASVGAARRSARAGLPIKLLAYNGVSPDQRTIQNHVYALSRPLTLITRSLPKGLEKQFIEYALSKTVMDLQLRHGFVPYEE